MPEPAQAGAAPGAFPAGWGARLRELSRTPAVRDSAVALIASRLLIWAVGMPAWLVFGPGPEIKFDHFNLTTGQGPVGNTLIAPAVRWDSAWYMDTARSGYLTDRQTAFFPLYALLARWLGWVVGSPILAGILISLAAFFVALVMLHRLTDLELGEGAGRRTVLLLCFFPFTIFFSAVYAESLFLALGLGAFWSARKGTWWLAGVLGGCAAATRNGGVLLLPILLFVYLYGPREDARPRSVDRWWKPRYPLRPGAAWLALVAVGLGAYMAWLSSIHKSVFAPFRIQEEFQRSFEGPLSAVRLGAIEAVRAVGELATGAGGVAAVRTIGLFGVACLAILAAVGVLRRLPPAYGVYALVMAIPVLSFPQAGHPLASASRYLMTIFPLFMWAGWRLSDRRWFVGTLAVFVVGLLYTTIMFSTWRFVA
jgi:hypothetical protein